jgi:hypothetical protein
MSSLTPPLTALRSELLRERRPSALRLRAAVLMHRTRLDRTIAEGADPSASAELALRAEQLTRDSHRRALADSLEEAMSIAEGRSRRVSASPPLARREIRAARATLLDLSHALRNDETVDPAGVALTLQLLTDGAGPLYIEERHDALWHAARRACVALHRDA